MPKTNDELVNKTMEFLNEQHSKGLIKEIAAVTRVEELEEGETILCEHFITSAVDSVIVLGILEEGKRIYLRATDED